MRIYKSISQFVGNTPIIELKNFTNKNCEVKILAKLEYQNPAGSVKDRVALSMIEAAERSGELKPGSVIIEPTSGNTGIGLAAIAASRGYKIILTMPETMSVERRALLGAYGAQIILTEGSKGMKGAISKANELAKNIVNSFIPSQFDNPQNPNAHYNTTGPEIWTDTEGNVDIFVAGVGTGGTITGVGRYLKEQSKNIKIIAIEPSGSPFLSKETAGSHGIQGIGAGFVPKILDLSIIDEIITVDDEDAMSCAREIARTQGILVGISSGAAAYGAKILASRPENRGKTITTLFPDSGERYLSTALYKG